MRKVLTLLVGLLVIQPGWALADGPVATASRDPGVITDQIPVARAQQPATLTQGQRVQVAVAAQQPAPVVPAARVATPGGFGPGSFGNLGQTTNAFEGLRYLGLGGVGPASVSTRGTGTTYRHPDGTVVSIGANGFSYLGFTTPSGARVSVTYQNGQLIGMFLYEPRIYGDYDFGVIQSWLGP